MITAHMSRKVGPPRVVNIADLQRMAKRRLPRPVFDYIDGAADAASSAAEWASALPDQARGMQSKLTESACASIRARPLTTVAGALVVGYLLGRLARI